MFKHNFFVKILKKIDQFINSLFKIKLNKLNSLLKIKLNKLNSLLKIKLNKLNSLLKIKLNKLNSLLKIKLNKLNSLLKIKLNKLNSLLKIKLNKLNNLLKIKLNNLLKIKLNFFFKKKKLRASTSYNRASLFLVGVIFFILSYLSIPYLYNSNKLIDNVENQLSKNLNINFNLSENYRYSFFPRPYFEFEEVSFLNQIENLGKMKVNISISKLLFPSKIKIKDAALSKVNFNVNKQNYNFFIELLKNDFSNFTFEIKNSNIFYRNIQNDVLFINKIRNLKYYYDVKKLSNFFEADNEIFNISYGIKFKNDLVKKKITSIINFDLLKIKIENILNYKNFEKEGLIKFFYNKKKSRAEYNFSKDFFKFNFSDKSLDPNFIYKGTINLKPFFSESSGIIKEINSNELLNPNSILIQFLKTEVLNNKNLNMNTSINAKKITSFKDLINLVLMVKINEGLIDINKTTFSWLDNIDFKISDSLIHMKNNNLVLDALITIKINDYNELYKIFQTPRNYRKEIKKIEFNLSYNFDQFTANLNDIKVDGLLNKKINKTLNQFILKDNKLQNRIYFKNLMNKAIKFYAG